MEKRSLSVRPFPPRLPTALTQDGWWLCSKSPKASVCLVLPFGRCPVEAGRPTDRASPPIIADDSK
jgi:hypothetical protein